MGITLNNHGVFIPRNEINIIMFMLFIIVLLIWIINTNNTNNSSNALNLTHRDYKWFIVVLVISIVFIMTLNWGDAKDLSDKISFAGTLSSIILSVIAILMTIIAESKSEASKAQILEAEQKIKKSLIDLGNVYKKVKKIEDRINDDITKKLDNMLSRIEIIEINTKKMANIYSSEENMSELAEKIFFNKIEDHQE